MASSILPLNIKPTTTSTASSTSSSVIAEYLWDFTKNDFVLVDGKFQIVTGLEALKIWAYKALNTQNNTFKAYTASYGQAFDALIGKGYSNALVEAETKRLLLDCLTENPNITGIDNLNISFDGDTLTINFTLLTTLGTTQISYN
jgi:hypothetical protein